MTRSTRSTLTAAQRATGDALRDLVLARTRLTAATLVCPREKSPMTPCVARDGSLAVCEIGGLPHCVGCERVVDNGDGFGLLPAERKRR